MSLVFLTERTRAVFFAKSSASYKLLIGCKYFSESLISRHFHIPTFCGREKQGRIEGGPIPSPPPPS